MSENSIAKMSKGQIARSGLILSPHMRRTDTMPFFSLRLYLSDPL